MYIIGDQKISLSEANALAKEFDTTVEDLAASGGWQLEGGKTTVPEDTTPPTEPEKKTAAGDSSLADTSLESPKVDILPGLQYAAEKDLFKADETEGRERLEAYFKGVPGISFEEAVPGMDYVRIKYYDQNTNKEVVSDKLSFDTKNKDSIAKNMEVLSNFVSQNVPYAYASLIPERLEALKEKREKSINSYITPEFTLENNAKADNPELFKPVTTTKYLGGDIGRTGAGQTMQVVNYPYEKELAEASASIAKQADILGVSLTPDELNSKSQALVRAQIKNEGILKEKQRIAQQVIEDNIGAQGEAFIGDVLLQEAATSKVKENKALQIASAEQNESISRASTSINKLIEGQVMTTAENEQMVEDFNALGITIDPTNQQQVVFEDGNAVYEEYYKAAVQLGEIYEANYKDYQRLSKEGADINSKLEDINVSLDASRRSYDLGDKALYNIGLGFGDIGLGIAQLATEASKASNPIFKAIAPVADLGLQEVKARVDEARDEFVRDVAFEDAFNEPGNFGKFALQEVANQIPILVTMMAGGGAASYIAGASSAGGKMLEMKGEILDGTADYSDLEIALKATGYGLAEGVFAEISTVPILNRAKQTWVRAGKSDVVDNGTRAFFREKSPSLVYEPLLETGGESATQITQNLIDGKPALEGVDHAGASGFGFGLLFAGVPFVKGMYSSRNSDYRAKAVIREKQLELDKLAAEWKASQSNTDMQRLEAQMGKARQELTVEIEKQENVINNNLRAVHGEMVIETTSRQSQLQNEAKAIQEDASLSKAQKKTRIEALRTEFDMLQSVKENSLSTENMMKARPEFVALEATDKARFDNLKEDAKSKLMREQGVTEPTEKQIEAEAYETYLRETIVANNNQAAKTEGAKLVQYETQDELIAAVESGELKVPEDQKELVINEIKAGSEGFSIPDGPQVVVIENQINSQKQHIATHEIGHYVFDKLTKNNPAKFKSIATQLIKSVKQTDNKLYKEFINSIERDANGNLKSDEVISRFLELVAAKKIDVRKMSKARGIAGLFGVVVQKEFAGEYDFDFKGEADIVNFVVGLGKKIASGKLTIGDVQAASENVILESEVAESTVDEGIKFSKTLTAEQSASIADMLSKRAARIEEAKKVAEKFGVEVQADAVQQRLEAKIRAELSDLIGKIVTNRTKALYDPIAPEQRNNVSREDFQNSLRTEIEALVFEEYKEGKQDIEKFLVNRAFLRSNNLASRLGIESAATGGIKKDIDTAKGMAVQEETTTEAPQEEAKYKSLLRRKIVDADVLDTAKGKVLSAIRVLKSSLDAKVSKNVTVTPLVAEIKKVMGKQLDIDLKKAMGGKKDGELRKFLLRNKAAILENMTTTYLMTAMPAAIQKQVDGVWTSDWAGKKIDREKVSTDNAGRTSGAELVRRLPKASTRISDADFLATILQADGNPIRGRKESLAKAIAEELAFDIIKDELQNPESEIAKAFFANQERLGVNVDEVTVVEFNKQADRGRVKFSKGVKSITERFNPNLDLELEGANKTNSWLKRNNLALPPDLRTEAGQDAYIAEMKATMLPLMPKSFWFGDKGGSVFTGTVKGLGSGLSSSDPMWKRWQEKMAEIVNDPNQKYGKNIPGIADFKLPSYTTLFKNPQTILQNISNGKINDFNTKTAAIHSAMWSRFSDAIKENRDNAPVIARYLNLSSSNTQHPQRMGAQFVGFSEGFGGTKDITFEHAMPNISSYLYLLDAALNGGDFNAAYTAVIANYKLLALDKKSDKKLVGRYKTNMPVGWNLVTDNWYDRYFNPEVAANNGGIDPNSIITLDGKKFGDRFGIKNDGSVLSKAGVKFSKSVNEKALSEAKKKINAPNAKVDTEGLSKEFNNILERKTGVESFKTFSAVQAQKRGEKKGKFKFFIAPSVDDFRGLVNYAFAGKGKQGEADMKWLEDNLMTPYAKGVAAIDGIRQQIKRDFKSAVKAFPKQYQLLNKEIGKTGFTYDQAVRVYLWGKAGIKVPGLSQKDTKILRDAIRENPELMDFADAMLVVARRDTWMEPSEYWAGNTLLSDLNSMTEKIGRKKYLEEFIANADAIFTTENLNKIEALYGKAHRDAIEDSLYSMKNGTNRNAGGNKQVNAWLNWINGSTGAIMFFNRRSALLQMLSFTNFINWSDNNPVKAAAAFANQKQYWSDWTMIFNSNKLKERRGGLRQDVSSDEIASIANASKNSPQAILARLLQLGFTPTQIADSMAIATGGAMYYRNRVNALVKQGMSQKDAEAQAFIDFSKKSDEAQQSSDPALVSQLQRSNLGRLIFAFQNTPMQYTRLMKKAALDLANNRGDWKENVSKIAYYGVVQNFIFSALQSALFAMLPGFDDDDEDLTAAELDKKNAKEEQKIARVLNSMLDTVLKGSGVYGAVFSTVKNVIREYDKQEKKGFMSNHAYTVLSLFDISPPIGSKARKVHSAIQTRKFEKDEIEARGWGVVADGRLDLGPNWTILGKVLSAAASVPLDRVVDELTSISEAFDARNKAWQRIALGLGWKTWDVGAIEENAEAIKEAAKKKRKEAGVEKAKETRAKNKNKSRNTRNTSAPRNVRK